MPFDTPEAEPAPTRRSSRNRHADIAATAEGVTAAIVAAAVAAGTEQNSPVPTSRRAARERSRLGVPVVPEIPVPEVPLAEETPHAAEVPTVPTPEPPRRHGASGAPSVDVFAEASRAFRAATTSSATTTSSSSPLAEETAAPTTSDEPASEHRARRTARPPMLRKLVAAGATMGIMGVAGLLAVSMTLPAEAVAAAQGAQASSAMSLVAPGSSGGEKIAEEEIQAFIAPSDVQNVALERTEDYSTISLIDLAAEQGIRYSDTLYTNDQDAAIQWPFAVGVAMSSGYGQRWGRLHAGIDLVPGAGAPIQAIADGTVRIATESGGAYGVTAYVDHVIDGEVVTSHYAHMQYGSLRVKAGDKVEVGDIIGLVGNTGRSYGAHLHFEIIINGSTVDPLPWLRKNAGRYSY